MLRWYIGQAIDSMIGDGVMYAELRPMLMDKWMSSQDGRRQVFHAEQMQIIREAVERKKEELRVRGELNKFPFGIKVIYCAPRSISRAAMQTELVDCINLKRAFPELICGRLA